MRVLQSWLKYLGIIFPIIAYGAIFVAIANAPWFSWYENALSDLGAYEKTELIFNGGLILAGLVYLIYSLGLFSYLTRPLGKIGALILMFDAISLLLVGAFPETVGTLHGVSAVLYFILFPIAYLLLGTHFIRNENNPNFGVLGYICSVVGLGIWFLPWKTLGVSGIAIPEFLASLANTIYIVVISLKLESLKRQ